MGDFTQAFSKMIANEGGYKLHTVDGDRGGMTYAGIARNFWPEWVGWVYIDNGNTEAAKKSVKAFYKSKFWNKIKCDEILFHYTAESIFDFAVNSGVRVASRIVQITVGARPDGVIGEKTLQAINNMDEDLFLARFALAKVSRYAQICNKNKSQRKFLLGWINRSLKGV